MTAETNRTEIVFLEHLKMSAYADCTAQRERFELGPVGYNTNYDCESKCKAIMSCPLNEAYMAQQGVRAGNC